MLVGLLLVIDHIRELWLNNVLQAYSYDYTLIGNPTPRIQ